MKFLNYFYNPFKPHIAKMRDGSFSVRKMTFIGWQYLDARPTKKGDDGYWWFVGENIFSFATFETLELAVARLERYKKHKTIVSSKTIVSRRVVL